MTKQEQFLFIVQTAILANGITLSSQSKTREKYQKEFSASGVLGMLDDAIYASSRIPRNMSAYDAAYEFCNFVFENLQTERAEAPEWFNR